MTSYLNTENIERSRSATQGDACQSKKGQPKNMIPWDKLEAFFKKNLK